MTEESAYIGHLKRFTTYLQEHDLTTTSFVVAAFAAEPVDALVSGLRMFRGMKREFHEYDANPKHLTKAQASKPPEIIPRLMSMLNSLWLLVKNISKQFISSFT